MAGLGLSDYKTASFEAIMLRAGVRSFIECNVCRVVHRVLNKEMEAVKRREQNVLQEKKWGNREGRFEEGFKLRFG